MGLNQQETQNKRGGCAGRPVDTELEWFSFEANKNADILIQNPPNPPPPHPPSVWTARQIDWLLRSSKTYGHVDFISLFSHMFGQINATTPDRKCVIYVYVCAAAWVIHATIVHPRRAGSVFFFFFFLYVNSLRNGRQLELEPAAVQLVCSFLIRVSGVCVW